MKLKIVTTFEIVDSPSQPIVVLTQSEIKSPRDFHWQEDLHFEKIGAVSRRFLSKLK